MPSMYVCPECGGKKDADGVRCRDCWRKKLPKYGPNCVECGKPIRARRVRGLCWTCSQDPDIRAKYPVCLMQRPDLGDEEDDLG